MHTIVHDKTISHLRKGEKATIIGYVEGEIPLKIYEMGLLPGVTFTMKQRLPLSGPVCLHINGNPNGIALRRTEAALILIEPLSS
ncbi:FeoA family protein [Parapedobacter sp. 10938]|uniref:FeoA family protein n=1 Tax=Parapedobacter flavus TaxID=3110225 RepID=UPI002DBA54C1|nr:FeoA family protein [Parapedobacter sp. 10938]MEC3879265.1 FeoA family protein [Parapedobacter sp. 10938]